MADGPLDPAPGEAGIALDPSQRAVLELAPTQSALVLGAPGTGRTTTLVELAAHRVLGLGMRAASVLALTSSRSTATRLRDALAARIPVATDGPMARSVASFAFDVVRRASEAAGAPSPRLITGGEQDADLAALLAGAVEDGSGPDWPEPLTAEVRRLPAFRDELRTLHQRATEAGLLPEDVERLGRERGRPAWEAAGIALGEYLDVVSAARPGSYDSTELVQFAVAAIARGDGGALAEGLSLVLVDDAQEMTSSTVQLLAALAARGVAVVLFGDPDVATTAYLGGEPDTLGRLPALLGVSVPTLVLGVDHRHPPAIADAVVRVTERIGTSGVAGHRRPVVRRADATSAGPGPEPAASIPGRERGGDAAGDRIGRERPVVAVLEAPTAGRQRRAIARVLREAHLSDGIPWESMLVVVRSGGQLAAWAEALALDEVPARTTQAARPVREQRAARALLDVVDIAVGRSELTPERASALLTGPFGGLDALGLRRLRLALRAEELAGDGRRGSDALLVEALAAPGRLATVEHRVGRTAARLSATLAAAGRAADLGATAEEVLWLVWERSHVAEGWRRAALGAGASAAEAGRDLDGVVALFAAARRFAERDTGRSVTAFLDELLGAQVPDDVLAPAGSAASVLVTTPAGAVGVEADLVVVAGLQEGSWPDLRVRDGLLAADDLVSAARDEPATTLDRRRATRDDELRLLAVAFSRARERLVVTWVASEDEQPSVFASLVPPDAPRLPSTARAPLTLRGLTGELRRSLAARPEDDGVARALARLAAEGVPGADPDDWHGLAATSTDEPLHLPDETVRVSPSKLEAVEESSLDWFLDRVAGVPASTALGVGTLVHHAMETAADPELASVLAALDERWGELVFEAPWLEERTRREAERLATAVSAYLRQQHAAGVTLVAAEPTFELVLGRVVLSGQIDRVERSRDGSVVIVDLKTGARPSARTVPEHPQLASYQLAYAEGQLDEALAPHGEHRAGGAKLLFVREGVRGMPYREDLQEVYDAEALAAFRQRVLDAAERMAAASFEGPAEVTSRNARDAAGRRLLRTRAVTHD